MFEITDTAPANLHFAIMADLIGTGLQQQITGFLKQETRNKADCDRYAAASTKRRDNFQRLCE